jgi:CheY-like chemotaxis protein
VSLLILVVDDESDVEMLFRQQFRRDLRSGRFTMEFAQSADSALQRISDAAGASLILILSDINMRRLYWRTFEAEPAKLAKTVGGKAKRTPLAIPAHHFLRSWQIPLPCKHGHHQR